MIGFRTLSFVTSCLFLSLVRNEAFTLSTCLVMMVGPVSFRPLPIGIHTFNSPLLLEWHLKLCSCPFAHHILPSWANPFIAVRMTLSCIATDSIKFLKSSYILNCIFKTCSISMRILEWWILRRFCCEAWSGRAFRYSMMLWRKMDSFSRVLRNIWILPVQRGQDLVLVWLIQTPIWVVISFIILGSLFLKQIIQVKLLRHLINCSSWSTSGSARRFLAKISWVFVRRDLYVILPCLRRLIMYHLILKSQLPFSLRLCYERTVLLLFIFIIFCCRLLQWRWLWNFRLNISVL